MALRRKLWLAAVPLAALAGGGEECAVRVGLMVEAPGGTPPAVLAAFRQETGRALELPGVQLQWRMEGRPAGTESFERLIMIRLAGDCSGQGRESLAAGGALGITHVADGQILPFVEADCGRVAAAARRVARHPFRLGQEEFGRALGRVVAHEIYHVLSASGEHDETGLSKAALSPAELFLHSIRFAPEALARMAAGLPRRTEETALLQLEEPRR